MKSIIYTAFLLIFAINLIAQNPVISPNSLKNEVITQYPTDCGPIEVRFDVSGFSICQKSPKLRYSYKVDFNNDGVFEIIGNGKTVVLNKSNGLKYGNHLIEWKVTDVCGNSSTGNKTFALRDGKKPTPVAKLLSIEFINISQNATLLASKVNNFSWDNCTEMSKLRFRLAKAGEYNASMTLDEVLALNDYIVFEPCKDEGTQTVALFAIDEDNNFDYVETFVVVQNPFNCDSLYKKITGKITFSDDTPIKNVIVAANNNSATTTDDNGIYNLKTKQNKIEIIPFLLSSEYGTISTGDLVALDKHLKNEILIVSPYKKIAADVNNDHKIDKIDYELLRSFILNISDSFNFNIAWKFSFVPKNYKFSTDTFIYPNSIIYDTLIKNNVDFIGVKIGAISKTTFTEAIERKAIPNLPIAIQNQSFRKGDEVKMKLKLPKSDAFSFTFQFDPSVLNFKTINGIDEKNYNLNYIHDGFITLLNINDIEAENEIEFIFSAKGNGSLKDVVEINSKWTKAELFKIDGDEVYNIYLDIIGDSFANNPLQCDPNPFTYYTNIKYISDKISKIHWKLIDLRGQKIKEGSQDTQIGINQFQISGESITTNGTYILQIFTDSDILTSKLIFIK